MRLRLMVIVLRAIVVSSTRCVSTVCTSVDTPSSIPTGHLEPKPGGPHDRPTVRAVVQRPSVVRGTELPVRFLPGRPPPGGEATPLWDHDAGLVGAGVGGAGPDARR